MRQHERTKQALYWTAVSLIVCEGLPFDEAARRMGIDDETLRDLLERRSPMPEITDARAGGARTSRGPQTH
jgi:hypothetical protein